MLLSLVISCGDKDSPIEDDGGSDDSGTVLPDCTTDTDCEDYEICEAEECLDGDRNNAADEAEELTDSIEGQFINPAGDIDYFTFTSEGAEFVRIITVSPEEEETDVYDTYLTLSGPDGAVVASVDNYPTGGSVSSGDSVLYAYLHEAGQYTIAVEDNGPYVGESAYGDDYYEYSLSVSTWSRYTEEDDAYDDPGYELNLSSDDDYSFTAIGVVLDSPGDVDYVEIDFPVDESRLYILGQEETPSGLTTSMKMYDEDGEVVMSRSPIGDGNFTYAPILDDGNFILELTDADGAGGDGEWFFVFVYFTEDSSTYPLETEANDSPLLATTLETTLSSSEEYTVSGGLGFADAPAEPATADEDWYAIEAFSDGYLVVCLNSEYYGSAIAPDIAIIDGDGETVLEEEDGDDGYPTAAIENVEVEEGETYYLKVTHPEDAAYTPLDWYEFVLYVAEFEVNSYDCPP